MRGWVSFNSNLQASSGNLPSKKKSVSKIIQLLEKHDLVDIWGIRNPLSKPSEKIIFQDTYKGV